MIFTVLWFLEALCIPTICKFDNFRSEKDGKIEQYCRITSIPSLFSLSLRNICLQSFPNVYINGQWSLWQMYLGTHSYIFIFMRKANKSLKYTPLSLKYEDVSLAIQRNGIKLLGYVLGSNQISCHKASIQCPLE